MLDPAMDDSEFYEFCVTNPGLRIERSAQGEIIIVPPAGPECSYRSNDLSYQLTAWARADRRGKVFDCSVEFLLPTGAAYCPDTAWVSNAKLALFTKAELRKFPRLVPEFVAEAMSPSDRLKPALAKMRDWMAAGVELGWLVDGDNETVYVYRAGEPEPEKRTGIKTLAGEGPIACFELDLTEIWAGL